jgi:hypothetical protein
MRRFRYGGAGEEMHCCCKLAFYYLPFVQWLYDCNDELSFVCHFLIHLVLGLYRQRCFVDAEAGIKSPGLLLVIYMHKEKEA